MTLETVREKQAAGAYKPERIPVPPILAPGYTFDFEQSAAWNRDMVQKNNEEHYAALQKNHDAELLAMRQFEDDVRDALIEDYDVTPKQASIICSMAKEEGHAYGFGEVLCYAQKFGEFAYRLLHEE